MSSFLILPVWNLGAPELATEGFIVDGDLATTRTPLAVIAINGSREPIPYFIVNVGV